MLPTDDKARKALPLWDFMFGYFPDAWLEVVKVAVEGNNQHNPGEKLHWARGKSMDQLNTAFRHQFDYGRGVARDSDGCYHLAKAVWRLMAQLQLDVEADRAATAASPPEPRADAALKARLAEAERNEGTLLGMIRHQRDVLRECLPYLNESKAGRRPGRSADYIRAAIYALTTDSGDAAK